jgi:hypothetical protein
LSLQRIIDSLAVLFNWHPIVFLHDFEFEQFIASLESFEFVIDVDVLRQAMEMMTIGNVAAHRVQATNRVLGIPNYYSIGGYVVSGMEIDERIYRDMKG